MQQVNLPLTLPHWSACYQSPLCLARLMLLVRQGRFWSSVNVFPDLFGVLPEAEESEGGLGAMVNWW